MNYNNKKFRVLDNSANGELSSSTVFHYKQKGDILSCTYSGNTIKMGQLIGLVDTNGNIDMRYHQINTKGEIMTGICKSSPEIIASKLLLKETWQWTSGDCSKGTSILEEI